MRNAAECGCGCGHGFDHGHGHRMFLHIHDKFCRRFISKEETKEQLEKYEDELKKELNGVGERIRDIESK